MFYYLLTMLILTAHPGQRLRILPASETQTSARSKVRRAQSASAPIRETQCRSPSMRRTLAPMRTSLLSTANIAWPCASNMRCVCVSTSIQSWPRNNWFSMRLYVWYRLFVLVVASDQFGQPVRTKRDWMAVLRA